MFTIVAITLLAADLSSSAAMAADGYGASHQVLAVSEETSPKRADTPVATNKRKNESSKPKPIGGPAIAELSWVPSLAKDELVQRRAKSKDDTFRPIAAVRNRGHIEHFVLDELVVVPDTPESLKEFLRRRNGKILKTVKLPGVKGQPDQTIALIGLDPGKQSSAKLPMGRLMDDAPPGIDRYEISSETGLALLRIAFEELLLGKIKVGLNWVRLPHTLLDGRFVDGVRTVNPPSFFNPFISSYLNSGSVQNTGVTLAWQLLKAAGILDADNRAVAQRRIRLAILDVGFHSGADLPGSPDFDAPPDVPNPDSPPGGINRWHGGHMAEIAAAVPGNGRAAAGPAGPVADMILIGTQSTDFLVIQNLTSLVLRDEPPHIISFSAGATFSRFLAFLAIPFDLAFQIAAANGILIITSSGNDGIDVGAAQTYVTPCELVEVLCVGALLPNSTSIARTFFGLPVTNFGGSVEIFAPSVNFVGPDPDVPGGVNQLIRQILGSSNSSAFTAGVAALIWSADPTQSAELVRGRLIGNASMAPNDLAPGTTADPAVPAWVNAFRAVRFTLRQASSGANFAPIATIVNPTRGIFGPRLVSVGVDIAFELNAVDVEDGVPCAPPNCTIEWSVNGSPKPDLTGLIVAIQFAQEGNFTVRATVTDSFGAEATASRNVRARN